MAISRPQRFLIIAGFFVITLVLYHFSSAPRSKFSPPPGFGSQHGAASPNTEGVSSPNSSQFHPGTAKPPAEPYTKTIVMARTSSEDVSWIYSELTGFNTSIYTVDNTSATLTVPANKGHEAMAYLTFIIDNYDSLPDIALFFHPHRSAWHNNILLALDSAKTISRLNPAHVARQGYFNARCHHDPGCPDWIHLDRPEAEWDLVKKKEEQYFKSTVWRELHPVDPLPPKALSQPCCAQFAVSRERIRARPRSEYEHYRSWLIKTPIEDEFSGRIMEYNWQYIFTGETEWCPPQHKCYCDGYGICFGGNNETKLDEWLVLLTDREKVDGKLAGLREKGADINEDKIKELEAQKGSIVNKIEYLEREANRRGEDPRARAEECGRPWKEGDGF